jgi:hypothetical protein
VYFVNFTFSFKALLNISMAESGPIALEDDNYFFNSREAWLLCFWPLRGHTMCMF